MRTSDGDLAVMRFNDFVGHSKAQAQADIARGEKWFQGFFGCFGRKSDTIVSNFDMHPVVAVAVAFGLGADFYLGVGGIGLQRIQDHFRQGMLERGPVALQDNGLIAGFLRKFRHLGRLVLLSFLVSLIDQRTQREGFLGKYGVARQKAHLID